MQKGDSAKLKLLLAGISARLTKNRDFFVQADCTLVSGKKKFDAKLSRADEDYTLHFQGSDRRVDAAEFCAFFAEQAEKYDESVLTYTERSTVVTLSVTARGVQMKQAEREATAEEKAAAANPLLDSGRQYLIRVDQAAALLREIGILTADGKLKNDMIRKYNQIDHYVELVAPMFEQDDSDEIVLLDCACGKSYLSFVMNYYIHEVLHRRCRVIGVDIKEHVIDESRTMAKRLGYHNMTFICADLRTYQPPKNVTAVISLHACDIATDLALGTAIRAKAKYIACVPCCHKELLDQYTMPGLEPLTKFGVFKARFNDVLTDKGLLLSSRVDFTIPSPFAREHLYYLIQYRRYQCVPGYKVKRDFLDMYLCAAIRPEASGWTYKAAPSLFDGSPPVLKVQRDFLL